MSKTGLNERELALMHAVFRQVPNITAVILFGSRAKGSHAPQSDIDLALVGITDDLQAQTIAEALDLLPMPYQFDVKPYDAIHYPPLLEHIKRVGVTIYTREEHGQAQAIDRELVVVEALWGLQLAGGEK